MLEVVPVAKAVAEAVTGAVGLDNWVAVGLSATGTVSWTWLRIEVGVAGLEAEIAGRKIKNRPASTTTAANATLTMAHLGSRIPLALANNRSLADLWTTPAARAALYRGQDAQFSSKQVLSWKAGSIVSGGFCV